MSDWKDSPVIVNVERRDDDFKITVFPQAVHVNRKTGNAFGSDRVRWELGPTNDGFSDLKFAIRADRSGFVYKGLRPKDKAAPDGTYASQAEVTVSTGPMQEWAQPGNQCSYAIHVEGKYQGEDFATDRDPDIVVDRDPAHLLSESPLVRLQNQADRFAEFAPEHSPLGREHVVEIEVVPIEVEPWFAARIPQAMKTIVLKRALGDTVLWKFAPGTPVGYGFFLRPSGKAPWVFKKGRYNCSHAAWASGPARGKGSLPEGTYGYDVVVCDRLHPEYGDAIADPDIVVDDDVYISKEDLPKRLAGAAAD